MSSLRLTSADLIRSEVPPHVLRQTQHLHFFTTFFHSPLFIFHTTRWPRRVNTQFIFDVCHDAYRHAWAEVYEKCGMKAIDAGAFKNTTWRPDNKPRMVDYLADFSMAGRAALQRADKHSRLVFFEMYCLGQASWRRACRNVGINELTGANWLDEIRTIVGEELLARGVYPVRNYFLEPISYNSEEALQRESADRATAPRA